VGLESRSKRGLSEEEGAGCKRNPAALALRYCRNCKRLVKRREHQKRKKESSSLLQQNENILIFSHHTLCFKVALASFSNSTGIISKLFLFDLKASSLSLEREMNEEDFPPFLVISRSFSGEILKFGG